MKSIILVYGIILCSVTAVVAQPNKQAFDRIHAAKMAYIADRIHLTPEQSGGFTATFNYFEEERKSIRMEFRQKYGLDKNEHANTAVRHLIDEDLDYQQRIIDLKKKYREQFLKIISEQQYAELYSSEKEFNKMLAEQRFNRENRGRGFRMR
jgi:LTXXQ motif family protein/Synaphin protein